MKYPIVSIMKDECNLIVNGKINSRCPKNYIEELNKVEEWVIDSDGYFFKRGRVTFVKYINCLGGFSWLYGRFGICYTDIEYEIVKQLKLEDFLEIPGKLPSEFKKKLQMGSFSTTTEAMEFLKLLLS